MVSIGLLKVKERDKQISLVTSNKTEAYKKWYVRDKHTGWVGRGFFSFVYFVLCSFSYICCLLFDVLLHSHQVEQNQTGK